MLVWTKKNFEGKYVFELKDFLILWATLGIYNTNFSKKLKKVWIAILLLCWYYIEYQIKILCIIAFILQSFYEGIFIKILKTNKNNLLFWRQNLWLKPLTIGLMWTLATLIFPLKNPLTDFTKISCFLMLEKWSWVSALAIATDIFDQKSDNKTQLKTFPTTFNHHIVFIFIFLGFFISLLSAFAYFTVGGYSMRQLQLKIIFTLISFYIIYRLAQNIQKFKHLRSLVDVLMMIERVLFF